MQQKYSDKKKSLPETNPLKQTVQTISNTLIHNINEADYENNMCAHMYISAHAFRRFYLSDRNQILQKILGWLFCFFTMGKSLTMVHIFCCHE